MSKSLHTLPVGLILSGTLCVQGCGTLFNDEQGYFRDRTQDYLITESPKPLNVPEQFSNDAIQPLHRIPDDPRATQTIHTDKKSEQQASEQTAQNKALLAAQATNQNIQPVTHLIEHSPFRVWLMSEFAIRASGYNIKNRDQINRVFEIAPQNTQDALHASLKIHLMPGQHELQTKLEVFDLNDNPVAPAVKNQVLKDIVHYIKQTS